MKFLLDTGASVNIIDGTSFLKIQDKVKLLKCSTKIYSFQDKNPLELKGKFICKIKNKGIEVDLTFYVLKGDTANCILGYEACVDLKFINIVNHLTSTNIAQEYPDLFNGIGKYKKEKIKLHINLNEKPVA